MSRFSYGRKKDFGFHKGGAAFLPDAQNANVDSQVSNYRSTMPAYSAFDQRGQHGKLDISSRSKGATLAAGSSHDDTAASTAKPKEKKAKRWFGDRKKSKKGRLESDIISDEKVVRSSPILHVRSWGTADVDQFGRSQTEPSGVKEEEERMQSYDEPTNNGKNWVIASRLVLYNNTHSFLYTHCCVEDTPSINDFIYLTPFAASNELLRLTVRSKKSHDTLQVTLRKKGQGFGIHLSGGFPPITVTYTEPGIC